MREGRYGEARLPQARHTRRVSSPAPIELALTRGLFWALGGAAGALLLIAIPAPGRDQLLTVTTVHLGVLVSIGLVVVWDLGRHLDDGWFRWLGSTGRKLAAGASVVALTVGVVALIALATSAALRLDPSLQFLQLLSALDIAWAAGATFIGTRWLLGRRAGWAAGALVAVVCVWSIWNYQRIVGFTPVGGWQVDGGALFRYVLPYDIAAALVAVSALMAGARREALTSDNGTQ